MKLVDLNVLLYAINVDTPTTNRYARGGKLALSGRRTRWLGVDRRAGVFSLATSPPVSAATDSGRGSGARRGVDNAAQHPAVRNRGALADLQGLLQQAGTAGNLTTHAHLAALAIARGATLVSCDGDFGRFRQLKWESPLP